MFLLRTVQSPPRPPMWAWTAGRVRTYSGWGMDGIWSRLKNGFTRTDAAVLKKEMEQRSRTKAAEPDGVTGRQHSEADAPPPADAAAASTVSRPPTLNLWDLTKARKRPPPTEIWMQSQFFRCSPQKLSMLGRQISRLALDAAILQMQFSPKKAAVTVLNLLCAIYQSLKQRGADPSAFFIREATVGRGPYLKRLDIRARGKCGIIKKPHAFIRICCHKPDPRAMVRKLLRIKRIPYENIPVQRRLDYY